MKKVKNKPKDKTVGQQSVEALQEKSQEISVIEQQKQMQSEYMKYLLTSIDEGFNLYRTSFFVEVQTKNEKLMPNVFRNYFIHRRSCPSPNYDQSVFRYNVDKGQVEYLWTVPSRDVCFHLKDNATLVSHDEKDLLGFVLKFADGTLFKMCKHYNDEKPNSPELNSAQ